MSDSGRPSRFTMVMLGVLAAASGCMAVFAWSRLSARPNADAVAPADGPPPARTGAPEVYSTLPDFSLTRHDGGTFTRQDMLGKVWVADFFFIACPAGCPTMNSKMAEMQGHVDRLVKDGDASSADVGLVSITVNPAADDLPALRNYARNYHAGKRWVFLTGAKDDIRKLAADGFKVSSVEDINMHSTKLILVDRKGRVRGWYSVVPPKGQTLVPDENDFERLKADVALLLAEKP